MSYLKTLSALAGVSFLMACTPAPHLKDWDRERLSLSDINKPLQVGVCFDKSEHSQDLVYGIARDECAQRIDEIETLRQNQATLRALQNGNTVQRALEGPIKRQARIEAMKRSLKLTYIRNTVWDCPLMTPNYILLACSYDPNARESVPKTTKQQQTTPFPDLPPELPEDLKPQ